MLPFVRIVFCCHQGNVKEAQFDKEYFKRFSLVLSGLDNVEARRHVNRLCLSAGVPLIESGTEGYLGQVCLMRSWRLGVTAVLRSGQSEAQTNFAYPCSRRGHAG